MDRYRLLKENLRFTTVSADDWMNRYPLEVCNNSDRSIGECKRCPQCKLIRQTTCQACGCGYCCYCGHRFTCLPTYNDEIQSTSVTINGVETFAINRDVRPGDSVGLLFADEDLFDKILNALEKYEYVMIRKKNKDG